MEDKELLEKIEDCAGILDTRNCPFNSREKKFIESVYEQYFEKGFLTDKQIESLEKAWKKI